MRNVITRSVGIETLTLIRKYNKMVNKKNVGFLKVAKKIITFFNRNLNLNPTWFDGLDYEYDCACCFSRVW